MVTKWTSATIIENKKLTDRHFSLIFEANLLPFEAGQFLRLQIEVKNDEGELKALAKPYSLVNTPDEKYAEVYFNTVPDGKVSNALAQLQAGDIVEVSQPCIGFFVLSLVPEVRHIWMLSTGTGIGPYLSMLKTDEAWKRFEKIILVHAIPYANELCYVETIETFVNKYPDKFQFIPIVSREDHEGILNGRIPELIKSGALEEKAGLEINKENSHIMLCGNSGMLKDSKLALKERGMDKHLNHKPGHISSEQYF